MRFADFIPLDVSRVPAQQLALVRATLEDKSPPTWIEMAELSYMILRDADALKSIKDQDLADVCVAQIYQLMCVMGGGNVYFAKGVRTLIAEKARLIASEFRGNNHVQLARKYRLSTTRIFQIVEQQAALKRATNHSA